MSEVGFIFLLASESTREGVGVAGCCCRCCRVDETGRADASEVHPAVSSSPPTSPAQAQPSCCSHPARTPWVRRDPGQTPSYIFLSCCHKQSVTPLPEPPSTYVQSHSCKERPLPSSFSSPRACSPWVKNAIFPEIWSPPTLALRPELLDTF